MNFETSKTLGGIGAILLLIGSFFVLFPWLGIIGLIGLVLVLVSLYGFAQFYNDRAIFNNAIFGVVAAIVGCVIAVVIAVITLLSSIKDFLLQIYPEWNGVDWSQLQTMTPDTSNLDPTSLIPFVIGFLIILVIVWIFAIIASFFVRRSLKEVAIRSGTGLFATAGLLLLIGAFLTIIVVGVFLMWIAAILLAVAFFTMKHPEAVPPPPVTMAPPAPPAPTSV
jgi:uncharacterized membrane protein